ncbi:Uncharacterised protein [Neisseria meningitidis]|nr:Uncharacterised protein [Neisseria meningitidis]CWP44838.1 Uncharacterised protein [Neisseria meningitidis]CWQ94421.1 Uncharacterised protein [Neisseria meningitidis]CWT47367.1 Uncharacterised protein [Neisseria meningitidis]
MLYLAKMPTDSHRHRPETKLTKADEFAAGIHHCNGALQSQKKTITKVMAIDFKGY